MIRLLSRDETDEIASIYESEWDADVPGPHDAVIADVDDGEIAAFITSEAFVRIGMLWLSPRLRKTVQGAKRLINLFKYLRRNAPLGSSIIVIADIPQFESICKKYGMRPIEGKVYRLDV